MSSSVSNKPVFTAQYAQNVLAQQQAQQTQQTQQTQTQQTQAQPAGAPPPDGPNGPKKTTAAPGGPPPPPDGPAPHDDSVVGPAGPGFAAGLVHAKATLSQQETQQAARQLLTLDAQARSGQAHSKNEFTPQFKAAKVVAGNLNQALDAHLATNRPAAKAALDAMKPVVSEMVTRTAAEIGKDPAVLARCANVVGSIGKEGFSQAVKTAAPDVAQAFTQATGVQMMNAEVVSSALNGIPKAAKAVVNAMPASVAAKLPADAAGSIARACSGAAGKLGLATAETVASAATATAQTAAQTVAKEAAKEGVKAAATTAATTGGKALPAVGNAIAVCSTCLSAGNLVGEITRKEGRSAERIAKAGIHTLTQAVGIAFPWVALAGDVVNLGWSAKISKQNADKGVKIDDKGPALQEAAGMASQASSLLSVALAGAGHADAAASFKGLADTASTLGNEGNRRSGESVLAFRQRQEEALQKLAQSSATLLADAAAQTKPSPEKDALSSLSYGFGELFKTMYASKKADAGKREAIQGDMMRILTDVAAASACLASDKLATQA